MKKVMIVFGTRPELIKLAPVVHAFRARSDVALVTVSTSQHTEMLQQMLDVFDVKPDHELGLMEANQSLFSSAGYFIRLGRGVGFTGVMNGQTQRQGNRMIFRAYAQRPTRLRQRPLYFLGLRVYQLLVGKFMPANLGLKWLMARLLLFRRSRFPFRMTRTIRWADSDLMIEDHLENLSRGPALVRHCREGYLHFMGSARYFDASCLLSEAAEVSVRIQAEGGAPGGQEASLDDEWRLPGRGHLKIEIKIPFGARPEA